MAHVLTESGATFPASVTVPDDTDGATGASIETPVQALADRTQYLKGIVGPAGTGVTRIRRVADFTGLRAVTGMTNTDVRFVDGYGLYYYDASLTDAEVEPWIIAPSGGGAGRWTNQISLLQNIHLATLDSGTGKVVEPVPNRLVEVFSSTSGSGSLWNTASTSYVDVASWFPVSLANPCTVGDVVMIDCRFRLSTTASDGSAAFAVLAISENGGAYTQLAETEVFAQGNANKIAFVTVTAKRTVAATGAFALKLQMKTSNASYQADVSGPLVVRATVIRP